jgi:hypothetical protein
MIIVIDLRRVLYRLVGLWANNQPPNSIHCCSIWLFSPLQQWDLDRSRETNQTIVNIDGFGEPQPAMNARCLTVIDKVLSGGIVPRLVTCHVMCCCLISRL